ncbi:MurR/RpiR family transcriptional regulator [Nakamurella lactea]|uniref:MurR/RpiR family transcriptional regulator n=1 Tax=Nakamurella lactea TaxID=459515 RepID=UPI000405A4F6|nr:SIS domain-containing protein [Nakamurella lactea]
MSASGAAVLTPTPALQLLADAADRLGDPQRRLYRAIAADYPASLAQRPSQLLRQAQAAPHELQDLLTAAGLGDYAELRVRAEREEDRSLPSPDIRYTARLAGRGAGRELLGRMIAREQQNLRLSLESGQATGAFDLAAGRIVAARRRFVTGDLKSAAYALMLSAELGQSMSNVVFVDGSSVRPLDVLCDVRSGDVLVAFCFRRYSRRTVTIAREFRAAGGAVIGLTDSADSPLGLVSDLPVVVSTGSVSHADSPTAVAAAVHVIATLATASAKGAGRRLERRNQLAATLQSYEES